MKLNKIYISAFGGLKDFTLDLADGLNVIYGNNEDGKSTVMAFIKSMFYGTGRNAKNLVESTRLKYTPWDGSTMGGRIYFEDKGKNYCLEREFRKSDSTDRITLTDMDSGKQTDVGCSIGQQFLGLSAAAFERSLFIGNADFIKDDTAASEINSKLSNIAVTGTDDVSYKKIEKKIFDARTKLISKSGRTGSYNEDLQALDELNSRLKKSVDDAKAKSELNDTACHKRAEFETLYQRYTALKSTLEREQDFKNREKLTEFLDTKRQLDELNNSLKLADGTIINEAFAQKIEFCLGVYEKSFERCEQINNDISRINEAIKLQNTSSPENAKQEIEKLNLEVTQLTAQKSQLETQEVSLKTNLDEATWKLNIAQSKKMTVNPIFLILTIIFGAGCGAAAYFVSPIVAAVMAVLSAISLVLSFVIRPKNTAAVVTAQNEMAKANTALSEAKADKNRIQEQINNINARINILSSVINADSAIKTQRLADLAEKNEALKRENSKIDSAKSEIFTLLSGFDNVESVEQARALLADIKQKTENQKAIKLQLKTASQFLGNIDYDEAQEKLNSMQNGKLDETVDFEAVKTDFEEVSERISTLKEQLTVIATELKTSFKNSENPEDLKRAIAELQERINSKKAFCDAADLALDVLEQSFYELRRGYGSELETLTHSIFAKLTDDRYKSVNISDSLDISVEKTNVFGTREIGYLSLGTTHQAYLSLRLAIASLIEGESPLPVFLDDSLSQYDDIRTKKAIAYLKEFCNDRQGIFFTCHNSICDIADNQGISVLRPYK